MNKVYNLEGQKFGRLKVLFLCKERHKSYGGKVWACQCECGKIAFGTTSALNSGDSVSCGCSKKDTKNALKHGYAKSKGHGGKTPEYNVWCSMKRRCNNKNAKSYPDYGGRGIKVCDRWLEKDGFENFLADMGRRPSPRHEIDRIDNDGEYSLKNCHWATRIEQANNKRSNRFLTYQGKTQTASQWAREIGVTPRTILGRIKRGCPVEKILQKGHLYD